MASIIDDSRSGISVIAFLNAPPIVVLSCLLSLIGRYLNQIIYNLVSHLRNKIENYGQMPLLSDLFFCLPLNIDARNVAAQQHVLSNANIRVSLLQTWPETVSLAVRVEGFNSTTKEETIILYFENKNRSGGDAIDELYADPESKAADGVLSRERSGFLPV